MGRKKSQMDSILKLAPNHLQQQAGFTNQIKLSKMRAMTDK
jgi:hypothetical protein